MLAELVFWALLTRELSRRCVHGYWDPTLGEGACLYCDTGMST